MINAFYIVTLKHYHTIKFWLFIPVIVISLIMLSTNLSYAMGSMNRPEGKGLYRYSVKELSGFLKKIGYPSYSVKWAGDITRNSDGTELRFLSEQKALVVSCDGLKKEMDLPHSRSGNIWLNDEYQALAWLDAGKVYYKNGMTDAPPFMADWRADPSGVYFMKPVSSPTVKEINGADGVEIYSIEKPNFPLAKVIEAHGERIFLKDDKVYLFGSYFDRRDVQKDLYIFQRKDDKLELIEKVIIPRPSKSPAPFSVDDFSPWTDEVLFADIHDLGRSELYVFNLKTHEMKKIGKEPFGGGWGFYLQCDIIKNVLEKNKSKR